ncbi:MAG: putative phosphoribosyl transferase [Thermoanaerobaculia bacterium]|jgi:predicted phosphoribosyltransferase|nr:putative phosphoribosyl transferase [Thermoanaerobaculia bacterium]
MRELTFRDRTEAGLLLGAELRKRFGPRPDALVLALPRGGVPVGFEVASALSAPFDVFIVRKLGVPGQEELAMGAIASGGVRVLNDDVVRYASIPQRVIDRVAAAEQIELERREESYRGKRPPVDVAGRTVIIVDDGLATGSTMRAAIQALRNRNAREVIVSVPVAAKETCAEMRVLVDDIVCLRTPSPFQAVGLWYDDFSQTSDAEVHELLERAAKAGGVTP